MASASYITPGTGPDSVTTSVAILGLNLDYAQLNETYGTMGQNNLRALRDIMVQRLKECKTWNTSPTSRYNKEYSEDTIFSDVHYKNVARQLLGLRKGNSAQYVKVTVRVFLPSVKGN